MTYKPDQANYSIDSTESIASVSTLAIPSEPTPTEKDTEKVPEWPQFEKMNHFSGQVEQLAIKEEPVKSGKMRYLLKFLGRRKFHSYNLKKLGGL